MMVSAIQLLQPAPVPAFVEPVVSVDQSLCALWQPLFRAYASVAQQYQPVETLLFPSRQLTGGYGIYDASYQPTGLSLVAEPGQTGRQWYVYYERARRNLAGPYDFKEEAEFMAALLITFDWTRPVPQFSRRELRTINHIITLYRSDLRWFREVILEVWAESAGPKVKESSSCAQATGAG